jgi:hypothetical protein
MLKMTNEVVSRLMHHPTEAKHRKVGDIMLVSIIRSLTSADIIPNLSPQMTTLRKKRTRSNGWISTWSPKIKHL